MKLQNPFKTSEPFVAVVTLLGGALAGSMLSRGIIAVIHTPTVGADATVIAKEKTELLAKRGVIVVGSTVGASAIKSDDTLSILAKGACIGAGGIQIIDGVADFTASNAKLADTSTTAKKFIAGSLGLGCPTPMMLNGRRPSTRRKSHALRIPYVVPATIMDNSNPKNLKGISY